MLLIPVRTSTNDLMCHGTWEHSWRSEAITNLQNNPAIGQQVFSVRYTQTRSFDHGYTHSIVLNNGAMPADWATNVDKLGGQYLHT